MFIMLATYIQFWQNHICWLFIRLPLRSQKRVGLPIQYQTETTTKISACQESMSSNTSGPHEDMRRYGNIKTYKLFAVIHHIVYNYHASGPKPGFRVVGEIKGSSISACEDSSCVFSDGSKIIPDVDVTRVRNAPSSYSLATRFSMPVFLCNLTTVPDRTVSSWPPR